MSRTLGTVARGVRTPIFREGDNVVEGVVSSVLTALKENGIQPHDKDVAAVTESVVARCQGNYATVEQIAADVKAKTGGKTVGVTFPILSRNRFSLLLSGIAAGVEKVVLMLSYPSDEVGNHLVSLDQLDEAGIDPWHDVLDLEQFRAAFGKVIHPFTGVDYVDFYKGIIEDAGAQAEIVFANRVQTVLDYTDTVICCDIHTRQRSKRLLKKAGARVVLGLDDLLTAHGIMTRGLVEESGMFRTRPVGVVDSEGHVLHFGTLPQYVPDLVMELLEWVKNSDVHMPACSIMSSS